MPGIVIEDTQTVSLTSSETIEEEWTKKQRQVKGFARMFKAENVFDKQKLKNDIDNEFEDIVWRFRVPIFFILLCVHVAPAVHVFIVKGLKVRALDFFMNALFPILVPLAVWGGYKMPYVLAICDNNQMWNNIEYKIACSWCNAFIMILLLTFLSIIAWNLFPLLFVCAMVDVAILLLVTYRIAFGGAKGHDAHRFEANSKRAAKRKFQQGGNYLGPEARAAIAESEIRKEKRAEAKKQQTMRTSFAQVRPI